MSETVQHLAGGVCRVVDADGKPTRLIVQACSRCGAELQRFDEDNPPQVACVPGETPRSIPWWTEGDPINVSGDGWPTVFEPGGRGVARLCEPGRDGGEWKITEPAP